jgi:TetR/AcrR family tetracycline transcriptional repressor
MPPVSTATGQNLIRPLTIRTYTCAVKSPLDRSTIVSAGCQLARRSGLEAVGVRSVARSVGVTPMALYRHVSDADDLHDAVLAEVCESLPSRPQSVDDLRRWAHDFRAWLLGVPGLSRLVLIRWFELPPLLDSVEALLEVFNRAGRAGFELVAAANSLFSYVLARAELEEAVRASGVRRSLQSDRDGTPRPLLDSLRDQYEVARLDEHFDFGLQLVLVGVLGQPGMTR